jgi:hypothetical protein
MAFVLLRNLVLYHLQSELSGLCVHDLKSFLFLIQYHDRLFWAIENRNEQQMNDRSIVWKEYEKKKKTHPTSIRKHSQIVSIQHCREGYLVRFPLEMQFPWRLKHIDIDFD